METGKIETSANTGVIKVPLVTKIAYGGGDVACNMSLGVVSTLLTLFYTDYVGIPAATVGLVMLISRVFDGVSDIIMGFIVAIPSRSGASPDPGSCGLRFPLACPSYCCLRFLKQQRPCNSSIYLLPITSVRRFATLH